MASIEAPVIINSLIKKHKIVDSRTFLRIVNNPNRRRRIRRTRYLPAKLGSNNFGKFLIEYEWSE